MRGASVAARAERWSASGPLDLEFYGALRGRTFATAIEAAEDFVGHGMGERLSPHPFLDLLSLPAEVRRAFRLGKVNPVLQHLTGPDRRVRPVGPLADAADPAAMRAHLVVVAGRLGSDPSPETPSRDRHPVGSGPRVAGRTSVVVLSDESRSTLRSAASVVRHADDLDVEVVVVDRGLPPHVVLGLHAWACARFSSTPCAEDEGWLWIDGATRLVLRHPVGDGADTQGTGDLKVLLDASCEVRRGWLPPLVAALADFGVAAVQPLLLQPNDTIAAAGLSETGTPLLGDHPAEDALRLEGVPVPAISGLAVAVRARDEAAGQRSPDGLRVAPRSWVTTSSTDVGSSFRTTVERVETPTALRVPTPLPGQLRWSINLPSTAGHWGDNWGDTFFAAALGRALGSLGQEVVTRRRGSHQSGPTHLDDVVLGIRGRYPLSPSPGRINVLWVISHPQDVDPGEFEGFDLVCAASTVWSEEMSARTGREVVPLLQATEFEPPDDVHRTTGPEARTVFVGSNVERERPLVWQAVEAGIPLAVYGPGWDDLPEGVWRGAFVPNHQLPGLYRRHGIVLADHWPDMAKQGFIANRVFDAVACGAAVISDDVVGIHDVFDAGDVVVATTPQEIRDAVDQFHARSAPPRHRTSELSFDARAAAMLDLVLAL